jgi:hypothetical protein
LRITFTIFYSLATIFLISCISSIGRNNLEYYKKLAVQKYNKDTTFLKSPDQNNVLCLKSNEDKSLNPFSLTEFFIYNIPGKSIVFEDKLPGISFKWKSDDELLICQQRGIIDNTFDSGKIYYIYKVKTRKLSILSKSENDSNFNK